jgi:tetratricopeptide (TPR) repeat protein
MSLSLLLVLLGAQPNAASAVLPERIDVQGEFNLAPVRGQELRLLEDAADGTLQQLDLLTAALIASGVPDSDLKAQHAHATEALASAVEKARHVPDLQARGGVLLSSLHDSLFRRYDLGATEISKTLETGQYNCVSSATLFAIAAEGLLDNPRAVFTPRHAYVRVTVAGQPVDVETTTARGFAPRREAKTDVARVRGYFPDALKGQSDAEVLASLSDPEELPALAFIAAIYANRGVALVNEGNLAAAATAFDRGARVAPAAMREKIARWRASLLEAAARSLVETDRAQDARTLLLLALEGTGAEDRARISYNLGVTLMHLARKAAEDDRHADAVRFIEEALSRGVTDDESKRSLAQERGELASQTGDARLCRGATKEQARCLARLSLRAAQKEQHLVALAHARAAQSLDANEPQVRSALFYALMGNAQTDAQRGACAEAESAVHEAESHAAVAKQQDFDGRPLLGTCLAKVAQKAYEEQRWVEADRLYTRARVFLPEEPALLRNLARVALAQATTLAQAEDCDGARVHATEAKALWDQAQDASSAAKATQVMAICWGNKAVNLAKAQKLREAVAASKLGLLVAPDDDFLRKNLGAFLHNWALALLKSKDCAEARALLPELSEDPSVKTAIEQKCRTR